MRGKRHNSVRPSSSTSLPITKSRKPWPFYRLMYLSTAIIAAFLLGAGSGVLWAHVPHDNHKIPFLRSNAPLGTPNLVSTKSEEVGVPPEKEKPKFLLPVGKIEPAAPGALLGGGGHPPPPSNARALHTGKRKVFFTFTAGHSGEAFLSELLKVSRDIVVDMEAFPSLVDFGSILHLGREATYKYRGMQKISSLEARLDGAAGLHYGDVNHMFGKSQVDFTLDYFKDKQDTFDVHIIHMRRWLPENLKYWLLEEVWDPSSMEQYVGGEYTTHHKPFALLPPFRSYTEEDSISLILGYLVDLELQFAALRREYDWATYHEFRYEDITAPNGTRRTLAALGLGVQDPTDVLRFEGTSVNDPLSWKDPDLKAIPSSVFVAAVEDFLAECRAAGITLPPLPHLSQIVPCEGRTVLEGNAAASAAGEGVLGTVAWRAFVGEPGAPAGDVGVGFKKNPLLPFFGLSGNVINKVQTAAVGTSHNSALPLSLVGDSSSGYNSASGVGAQSLLCGEPPVFLSPKEAKQMKEAAQIKRNKVGPGKYTPQARALDPFLSKMKGQWGSTLATFEKQRKEAEKLTGKIDKL